MPEDSSPDFRAKFDIRYSKYEKEFWKLFRFVIVGGGTFALQSVIYIFFSRFLFTDISRNASYILAVSYAVIFNYSAHRAWTFQDQEAAQGSAKRYLAVVVLGFFINAGVFWLGHSVLHIYDLIVAVAAGITVPFFTYAAHRLYTFHTPPAFASRAYIRSSADSV